MAEEEEEEEMGSKRAILFGHLSLTLPHFASASVAGVAALSTSTPATEVCGCGARFTFFSFSLFFFLR